MPWIIDAHQDMAYNMLEFQRDYRRSVFDTRKIEKNTKVPDQNGETLLGWPEYQMGQIAVIFGTLYITPQHAAKGWEGQFWTNPHEARKLHLQQYHAYRDLCEDNPEMFRLISSRSDFDEVLERWSSAPAEYPETTHPVGIALSMEGAEGLPHLDDLVEWRDRGVRMVGPVWGGGRYCGAGFGGQEPHEFTTEGYDLLNVMAALGIALDVSHMNHHSLLQAVEAYPGDVVFASHIACETVNGEHRERLITDEGIEHIIERDGVIGIVPANAFLRGNLPKKSRKEDVSLDDFAAHIDHVCQIAGNTRHVAFGTDFDGGFGLASVPDGLNTIADLQKMNSVLTNKGYNEDEIQDIFGRNWQRILENIFR